MTYPALNIKTDFEAQMDLKLPLSTTGVWSPPTLGAVTGISVRFALTPTGSAIGALSQSASERSAKAGRFYSVFDTAALVTALTAYLNQVVYLIWSKSGDMDMEWTAYVVTDNHEL